MCYRDIEGHHREESSGEATPPVAKDGSSRPTFRWNRSRLQQPFGGDSWVQRNSRGKPRKEHQASKDRPRNHKGRAASRLADPPALGVQPTASARTQDPQSQYRRGRYGKNAPPPR